MNDIGRKDVETYIRNLISEEFGRQGEDVESRGEQSDKGARADRRSGPDKTTPPTRKNEKSAVYER